MRSRTGLWSLRSTLILNTTYFERIKSKSYKNLVVLSIISKCISSSSDSYQNALQNTT